MLYIILLLESVVGLAAFWLVWGLWPKSWLMFALWLLLSGLLANWRLYEAHKILNRGRQ